MRDAYQEELQSTKNKLVELAQLVKVAITNATATFTQTDLALAEKVVSGDQEIDELSAALDDFVVDILVRQAPVAFDLRLMVSAMRIGSHLDRMGDLAEHIALFARYRYPDQVIPDELLEDFRRMGELDVKAAALVVKLLETLDLDYAEQISALDDELDELHAGVFSQVLSEDFGGDATAVVDATLASRYHERFGDHAVSIARDVLFLVSGDHAFDA